MIQIPWCRLDRIDLEVRKNEDLDTLRRPWWPPTDMTAEVRRKVSVRFVFIYFPDFSFWQTCWLAACFGMCCFIIREKLLLRWIFTQSIFCYFSIAPHTRKKKSFFLLLLTVALVSLPHCYCWPGSAKQGRRQWWCQSGAWARGTTSGGGCSFFFFLLPSSGSKSLARATRKSAPFFVIVLLLLFLDALLIAEERKGGWKKSVLGNTAVYTKRTLFNYLFRVRVGSSASAGFA